MLPYCASSSAARSRASGCLRNSSQTAGEPGGSGPSDGTAVAIAFAGDGAFAAKIERAQRVELTGVGHADGHAVLLLHGGIGCGGLHPAELNWRSGVLIEIGQQSRYRDGRGGKLQRRADANYSGRRRDGRSVFRDEFIGDAVIGFGAIDIELHQSAAGDLAFADGAMNVVDGRFLEMKAKLLGVGGLAGRQHRSEHQKCCLSSAHFSSENRSPRH